MTDYLSCGSCPSEFELQEFSHFIEHKLTSSCHQLSPTTNILECLQCFKKFHTSMSLLIHLQKDHRLAIVKIYALPLSGKESEEYNDVIRRINLAAKMKESQPMRDYSNAETADSLNNALLQESSTEHNPDSSNCEGSNEHPNSSTPFLKGNKCCVKVEMTEEGIQYHTCKLPSQHKDIKKESCCLCGVRPATCDQQNQTEFEDLENQGMNDMLTNSYMRTLLGERTLKPQNYYSMNQNEVNFPLTQENDPSMFFIDSLFHSPPILSSDGSYANELSATSMSYQTTSQHYTDAGIRAGTNGSLPLYDPLNTHPYSYENGGMEMNSQRLNSEDPSVFIANSFSPLQVKVHNSVDQEEVYSPFHSSESDESNPIMNSSNDVSATPSKDPLRYVNSFTINHGVRFKCEQCGRSFRQNVHLRKHVMSYHDQKKPHKCPLCDYSTVEKSHLTVHLRKHTGEKPFQCRDCEYSSAQNCTLKNHYFRKHPGSRTFCPHCKKEFVTDLERDNHVKLCQG